MRNVARPFALLLAVAWIAFWGYAIFLMWRPEYQASLSWRDLTAVADVTAGGMTRLVATLIAAVALLLALPVLVAAFLPQRGRVVAQEAVEGQPTVRLNEPRRPAAAAEVPADLRNEIAGLRASVERHEQELRALREHRHAIGTGAGGAADEERARAA
jgi:hypothetical protein